MNIFIDKEELFLKIYNPENLTIVDLANEDAKIDFDLDDKSINLDAKNISTRFDVYEDCIELFCYDEQDFQNLLNNLVNELKMFNIT